MSRYLLLIIAAVASLMPLSAQATSFNCKTADRPDEALICQSRELSDLDERMSSLYFTLRNRLRGGGKIACALHPRGTKQIGGTCSAAASQGGRHQIGTPAGFGSEQVRRYGRPYS
jgi:hypothetical protein